MTVLYEPDPRDLADLGEARQLNSFTDAVFGRLPRADQRRWAELYVRALLQTPGKKSVRRLADSVSDSSTASQSMHQFVNASPWDWQMIRQDLLHWVERTTTATAWALAPAFIPKRGEHSVGVHRRFDPFLGRTTTCQLGIGLFLCDGEGPLPVDWNLYIPENWVTDPQLRLRVRLPEEAGGAMWSQAAELVRRVTSWTTGPQAPLTADVSWLPDRAAFLAHLSRSEQPFVVEVPETFTVRAMSAPHLASAPLSVRRLLDTQGSTMTSGEQYHGLDILSLPVVLPGAAARQPRLRMLAQRRAGGRGTRVWLTNLVDRPLSQLLPLMRQPRLATAVVNSLSGDFGLQDFEGRSFPGWHHHATLVSAAFTHYRMRRASEGRAGG